MNGFLAEYQERTDSEVLGYYKWQLIVIQSLIT